MLNSIFWKKVQGQKHPGRWGTLINLNILSNNYGGHTNWIVFFDIPTTANILTLRGHIHRNQVWIYENISRASFCGPNLIFFSVIHPGLVTEHWSITRYYIQQGTFKMDDYPFFEPAKNNISPSRAKYGVSIMGTLEKIDLILFWLPVRRASAFAYDHQQNRQCLWFPCFYNVTHVFCPSLLYSLGNNISNTT